MATRRQSSLLASKRIQLQTNASEDTELYVERVKAKPSSRIVSSKRVFKRVVDASDASDTPSSPERPVKRVKKKPSTGAKTTADLHRRLFATKSPEAATTASACHFPQRQHGLEYHRPFLLHGELGKRGRSQLLGWYDGVSTDRSMPWRKPFVDPADYADADELRKALTQRAYEVFISEIMLQQTRVKTVIDYWNRWMEKWPTIYDLAKADEDDVMSAWRGLGYYSRCKRILEACRKIVNHPSWQGLMPGDAKTLEKEIPGVGPYTAGAISSIVFGRPAPMVDGNVLRVLSRQLGLLADTKTDKTTIDLIWACASALVDVVAVEATQNGSGSGEAKPNDAPGRWGQALMELGSTICTPSPNCSTCPITTTCRAYQEGVMLAEAKAPCRKSASKPPGPVEIEDLCQLCEPYSDVATEEPADKVTAKKPKQASLSAFFSSKPAGTPSLASKKDSKSQVTLSPEALKTIVSHAQKFPVKVIKKALREEETLVCAIQRSSDGMFLLQRRPEKGLLAGMWEFPSHILPDTNDSTAAGRKRKAREFVTGLFSPRDAHDAAAQECPDLEYSGELGSVPWVFSHLKLMMHVHLFQLNGQVELALAKDPRPRRWVTAETLEGETMGTGMRQCWKLVEGSVS